MTQFSSQEIEGGNYDIEFHFKKDERQFRLTIKQHNGCNYVKVEEQNDDGCLFHACLGENTDRFVSMEKALNNVLIEIYEVANNIMDTL